ncbi:putative transcriptional regulator [Actinacidiphila reveromycinica]|uniref:Putative transcriptional regulator n=1 Tax=Actinacidiphila reveromycinica TaxID=659352 RepID=A0A7U3UXD2_9ACTN|nr:Lrp/AsnC family transcriptional regulator [Streptomyces sp. SN-593]BBB02001.1 putative transcriptional regulator [Streptomyces sp. SN-593]
MTDDTDRRIIHSLRCAPRAAFRRISEVIGASEQTVARRYNALRRDGVLRVVGRVNPAVDGQVEWVARLHCRPGRVDPLAESLARRPEITYASIASGGSEIICIVRSPSGERREDLLLSRLPQVASVLGVSVDLLLHSFNAPGTTGWTGHEASLTPEQVRRLTVERPVPAGPAVVPTAEDAPLLDALAEDGRASQTRLAELTGWSTPRVARRLQTLESSGSLTYDVDALPERLGYELNATLWIRVDLTDLHRVGDEISRHDECAFAGAMSGRHNIIAVIVARDTADFYRYLTGRLARVDGIKGYEISIRVRRLKQAASLIHHGRLVSPAHA